MAADWSTTWMRISEGCNAIATQRTNLAPVPATTGYLNAEAQILSDLAGFDSDVDQFYKARLLNVRSRFSQALAGSYRDVLDPCLIQLSRVMGKPQTDPVAVLPILYDWMALNQGSLHNTPFLSSRNITRGAWAATGGNVGNGTINRLNVDQYGYPLESGSCEVKTFQVLADYQSGTNPGQEQFAIYGQPRRDSLSRYQSGSGSGIQPQVGALVGLTGDATSALVLNPSFADFSGTGANFVLSNWTLSVGVATSMSVDQTLANVYRACAIESTPGILKVTGSITLTQTLSTRAGALVPTAAYWWQIAGRRDLFGGGTGTITLQIGSNASASVVFAAQAGWTLITPTVDKNLYFYNFNQDKLTLTLTITVTSGTLCVDDLLWGPFTNIDGSYFVAVGGSTNWKYYDSGTTTDTEGNTSAFIQRAFLEAYGVSLPSVVKPAAPASAATIANGAAGVITSGEHAFCVTYVTAAGESDLATAAVSTFIFDGAHKASLTNIPTGPGGTTKRRIYMSKSIPTLASTRPVPFYYVAELADNVTTVATIDGADSTLTTGMAPIPDVWPQAA